MNNRELRKHIKALGEGHHLPQYIQYGLPMELLEIAKTKQYTVVWELVQEWPKRSASCSFPVPHPTLDPAKAFSKLINLWQVGAQKNFDDCRYVRRRLKMCRWVAKKLAKLKEWQ